MTALGRPLVVWDDYTTCNRCGGDVHITTDGTRVAAFTEARWECFDTERVDTKLTVVCGGSYADFGCRMPITVDLSSEHWTTDPTLVDRVEAHGVEVTIR